MNFNDFIGCYDFEKRLCVCGYDDNLNIVFIVYGGCEGIFC